MNALEKAKWNAEKADGDPDSTRAQDGLLYAAIAQVEATDRQTEQLKRIADMMEGYLSVYHERAIMAIARGEFAQLAQPANGQVE